MNASGLKDGLYKKKRMKQKLEAFLKLLRGRSEVDQAPGFTMPDLAARSGMQHWGRHADASRLALVQTIACLVCVFGGAV